MITSFIKKDYKLFGIIYLILLGLVVLFAGLTTFGSMSNFTAGNFGRLFNFVIYVLLLGLLTFCICKDKDDYTKFLAKAYLAYYTISELLSVSNPFWAFYDGNKGVAVAESVFCMIAIFVFIALVTIGVIQKITGKNLSLIFDILALSYLCLYLFAFIFALCADGANDTGWVSVMGEFSTYIFIPVLAVLGYYLYQVKFVVTPQDEKYEDFDSKEIEDRKE